MTIAQLFVLAVLVLVAVALFRHIARTDWRDHDSLQPAYSPPPPRTQREPAAVPTPRHRPGADRMHNTHADAERLWYIACNGRPLSRRDALAHGWQSRQWRRAFRYMRKCGIVDSGHTPLVEYDEGLDVMMRRYEHVTGLAGAGRYVEP